MDFAQPRRDARIEIDLALLCTFLDRPFVEAKREFRAALRRQS
jgi:hypothetical protein